MAEISFSEATKQRKELERHAGEYSAQLKKVREELDELEVELRKGDSNASAEELGDFLFSVINAARLYKINPDTSLELTNRKFIQRFNYIEQHSIKEGRQLREMSLEEMDRLWNEAKKQL